MRQTSNWNPYTGNDAILLAAVLIFIGGVLLVLGFKLNGSIGSSRPGKATRLFLVLIWFLSLTDFAIAVSIYVRTLFQQVGNFTPPANPVTPVTVLSGLATFITIIYLSRHSGLKTALGSAMVGTIAAPMIFELPFDLIVMGRTSPPEPATQYTLLYFLPLFLVEISSFSLLTLSPLTNLSKSTLFSLAAMFFVFAIWALFGFSYPSQPLPIALNAVSKVLSFVAATTLFLPGS